MLLRLIWLSALTILGLVQPAAADARPSGAEICKKMIADGRGGGMGQPECLCVYRIADTVLDDDLKALLFDSWLNGTDNMKAAENLSSRARVQRQMLKMQRMAKKDCKLG
jgi:hypothetical protein